MKFPKWFYQLGSPKWFYDISGKLLPWFSIAAFLLLVTGSIWGLVFAPPDYLQGNSYRIIFVHVPASILSQSCYMLMAMAGAIGLIWKMKMGFMVARACAPIGATMAILSLVTGAVWGKPTWGAWWVWDARITAMLVLLFLYLGAMALHAAMESEKSADQSTAVLTLVGLVNIPIIKYSVDWWQTLHQPATLKLTEKPAMATEMLIPLLIMILAFYCYFAVVLMNRTRVEVLRRERRSGWVQELLTERFR